tara:strand:- start:158 stop:334 length:177 start_codon:yes stop_codon:yes gene_type:complete
MSMTVTSVLERLDKLEFKMSLLGVESQLRSIKTLEERLEKIESLLDLIQRQKRGDKCE